LDSGKVYFIVLQGESVRACSNFTYIMMTLNQYMLIGIKHTVFLKKLANASNRRAFSFISVTSFLFSLLKTVGYRINYDSDEKAYPSYNLNYAAPVTEAYSIFNAVFSFINYFMTSLANVIIEGVIVIRLHRDLNDKQQNRAHLGLTVDTHHVNQSNDDFKTCG
jgi:hypothetical protein